MQKKTLWLLTLVVPTFCFIVQFPVSETVYSQGRGAVTPEAVARRKAIENELQSIAIIERKLMIPMRDGVRIATDVYRPKDTSKKYPTIFVRTPYNFNYWDVRNGVPSDMTAAITAILNTSPRGA